MRALAWAVLATCCALGAQSPSPKVAPPIVLHGGKIWTGDPARPEVEAVLIEGGRIVRAGSDADVLPLARAGTRRIDLAGRRAVPGLIDAHVHFLDGGAELLAPDLRTADSEEEFAQRLAAAAERLPKGTWITVGSWDHERWPGGALPTRAVLDRFVPDHPVFVQRLDGHMAVANSRALAIAGVTEKTPAPAGGTIVKDDSGEPAGVFKDNAMVLVSRHVPNLTPEQRLAHARAALAHAAELGVTGVHDMTGGYDALTTYQELRARGELTCRVTCYTPIESKDRWGAVRVRRGFGDALLKVNGCKGFADGSLGSTTAWFFAPYDDASETHGLPMPAMLDAAMQDDVAGCARLGLQVAIHAIGDRANAAMLDVFAAVPALERPRIEHAQHLRPEDVSRFAQLGVVASMQPYHAIDDGRWAVKRIGAPRCATTYAFRSLLDAGATLAFGSDWPVAPLSPWLGIYAAVTRRTLDGKNPDGWVPEQRITVEEALRAYTQSAAFAAFDERLVGTIEEGKLGDLVVLERDVLAIDAAELENVRVAITVVGGNIVFERD